MRCEILREKGDYKGDVVISIMGEDSRLSYNITQELSWDKKVTSEGLFSSQFGLVGGSLVAILIIGIVLFIFRRENDDEFEEDFDDGQDYDAPMRGPLPQHLLIITLNKHKSQTQPWRNINVS